MGALQRLGELREVRPGRDLDIGVGDVDFPEFLDHLGRTRAGRRPFVVAAAEAAKEKPPTATPTDRGARIGGPRIGVATD